MLTGLVLALGQSPLQPVQDPTQSHVAFLEVGCSDFNTAAQLTNLTGISVEVIPTYLERIPERPGLRKVNAAASNETGTEVSVYWTDPRAIEPTAESDFLAARGMTCGLPRWLRGCNQVGSMHANIPWALDPVRNRCGGNINDHELVHVTSERVLTVAQILDEQHVASLDFVKVDVRVSPARAHRPPPSMQRRRVWF